MPNHISSPHLVIHKRIWHYHLFCWSLGIVDAWRGSNGYYEERFEYGTSLFHYLRVILVYAPLVILSNIALGVWVVFSLFVIPVEVGGIWQYLAFWGLLFLLGAFLFLLRGLLLWWATLKAPLWNQLAWNFLPFNKIRLKKFKEKKYAPGLMAMVKRYIRSRRDKIRPLITFVEKAE